MDGRSLLAAAIRSRSARGLIAGLERVARPHPGRFAVLTYHRILPREQQAGVYPGSVSATPERFAEQMRFIAETCAPVPVSRVLAAEAGDAALPPRAVVVTFDDAVRDVARFALPTLQRFEIPATVFVPTRFVDASIPFWWDAVWLGIQQAAARGTTVDGPAGPLWVGSPRARARAFRRLRARFERASPEQHPALLSRTFGQVVRAGSQVLGSAELRALARAGIALAPHTRNHRVLTGAPVAVVRSEVEGGRADLTAILGRDPSPVFAYPDGRHDAVVRAIVGEHAQLAFSTERGVNVLGREPLALKRINVGARASPQVIRAQLVPLGAARSSPGSPADEQLTA